MRMKKAQDWATTHNQEEEKGATTSEEIRTKMVSTNAAQGVLFTLFLVYGKVQKLKAFKYFHINLALPQFYVCQIQ